MNRSLKTCIVLVVAVLSVCQTADAKTPRGRQVALRCCPQSVGCERSPSAPVPTIEATPKFQTGIWGILIADDPWTLINAQIDALQASPSNVSAHHGSSSLFVARPSDSGKPSNIGSDATG